jgi:hypothetical protein
VWTWEKESIYYVKHLALQLNNGDGEARQKKVQATARVERGIYEVLADRDTAPSYTE